MTRALLMVIDSHDAGTSEAVRYAYRSRRTDVCYVKELAG